MGEANIKSKEWNGSFSTAERLILLQAMDFAQRMPCTRCGAGPMKLEADPKRLTLWMRTYNQLGLPEIDELPVEQKQRALGHVMEADRGDGSPVLPEIFSATLPNDLVRFLIVDVLAERARFSFDSGAMIYLGLADRLFNYAIPASMKLREVADEERAERDDQRYLVLSQKEHTAMFACMHRPRLCGNSIPLRDGSVMSCAYPGDGPRGVKDLEDWIRLFRQIGLEAALVLEMPTNEGGKFEIDLGTAKLLQKILGERATNIPRGLQTLIPVMESLTEIVERGAGKPE